MTLVTVDELIDKEIIRYSKQDNIKFATMLMENRHHIRNMLSLIIDNCNKLKKENLE